MKSVILILLRLALIAAPAYNVYLYVEGEGSSHDMQWWLDNAGFIAWALGSYLLLLFASTAMLITWGQIIVLALGCGGLIYFYMMPDIYGYFLSMEFFQENKKALPLIPYAMTVLTLLIATFFKRRFKKVAKKG